MNSKKWFKTDKSDYWERTLTKLNVVWTLIQIYIAITITLKVGADPIVTLIKEIFR